jgi:hypothetical protein
VLFPEVTLSATRNRTRAWRLGAFRPARTSRWQAVLTMLAFVVSSLFGLIHEATTTHVRCAQHGELIDSDAAVTHAVRSAPPGSAGAAEALDSVLSASDLPGAARHDHEHCSLISAMRESRVLPRPPAIVPAPVSVGDLAVAVPRTATSPGRVLYRTAPKTSPPA